MELLVCADRLRFLAKRAAQPALLRSGKWSFTSEINAFVYSIVQQSATIRYESRSNLARELWQSNYYHNLQTSWCMPIMNVALQNPDENKQSPVLSCYVTLINMKKTSQLIRLELRTGLAHIHRMTDKNCKYFIHKIRSSYTFIKTFQYITEIPSFFHENLEMQCRHQWSGRWTDAEFESIKHDHWWSSG